jgi:hypothetical protein
MQEDEKIKKKNVEAMKLESRREEEKRKRKFRVGRIDSFSIKA